MSYLQLYVYSGQGRGELSLSSVVWHPSSQSYLPLPSALSAPLQHPDPLLKGMGIHAYICIELAASSGHNKSTVDFICALQLRRLPICISQNGCQAVSASVHTSAQNLASLLIAGTKSQTFRQQSLKIRCVGQIDIFITKHVLEATRDMVSPTCCNF